VKVKKGKYFFGTAKVGERGQIVIPKEARDMFKIKSGDTVLVMGDKDTGLAVAKTSIMKKFASKVMESFSNNENPR
jgi:AbrB family looped-hinge helix DNA binding protein